MRRRNWSKFLSQHWMVITSVSLIILGVGGIIDGLTWSAPNVTPEHVRFGWDEDLAKTEAPRIAAEMPKFAVTDAGGVPVSGEGKNQELWKWAKLANGGQHIKTWRQVTGDCVAVSSTVAETYTQSFQIAHDNRREILTVGFPPYRYGAARVQIGRRYFGNQPGATGAWAAQAATSYGMLPWDQAMSMGYTYDKRFADNWGWTGPTKQAIDIGSKHRLRTVSRVLTADEARDAIVFGSAVTVASSQGFDGGHYDEDGRRWLRPRGRWAHQMAFIGVEDRPDRKKGFYCQNQWGEDAHPPPLNDEPLGGFWVDWNTADRMLRQGDSWAYSDFDGFPAPDNPEDIDWNIFRDEVKQSGTPAEAAEIDAVEQPVSKPFLQEIRKWNALPIGIGLCLGGGIVFGAWSLTSRRRKRGAGSSCASQSA